MTTLITLGYVKSLPGASTKSDQQLISILYKQNVKRLHAILNSLLAKANSEWERHLYRALLRPTMAGESVVALNTNFFETDGDNFYPCKITIDPASGEKVIFEFQEEAGKVTMSIEQFKQIELSKFIYENSLTVKIICHLLMLPRWAASVVKKQLEASEKQLWSFNKLVFDDIVEFAFKANQYIVQDYFNDNLSYDHENKRKLSHCQYKFRPISQAEFNRRLVATLFDPCFVLEAKIPQIGEEKEIYTINRARTMVGSKGQPFNEFLTKVFDPKCQNSVESKEFGQQLEVIETNFDYVILDFDWTISLVHTRGDIINNLQHFSTLIKPAARDLIEQFAKHQKKIYIVTNYTANEENVEYSRETANTHILHILDALFNHNSNITAYLKVLIPKYRGDYTKTERLQTILGKNAGKKALYIDDDVKHIREFNNLLFPEGSLAVHLQYVGDPMEEAPRQVLTETRGLEYNCLTTIAGFLENKILPRAEAPRENPPGHQGDPPGHQGDVPEPLQLFDDLVVPDSPLTPASPADSAVSGSSDSSAVSGSSANSASSSGSASSNDSASSSGSDAISIKSDGSASIATSEGNGQQVVSKPLEDLKVNDLKAALTAPPPDSDQPQASAPPNQFEQKYLSDEDEVDVTPGAPEVQNDPYIENATKLNILIGKLVEYCNLFRASPEQSNEYWSDISTLTQEPLLGKNKARYSALFQHVAGESEDQEINPDEYLLYTQYLLVELLIHRATLQVDIEAKIEELRKLGDDQAAKNHIESLNGAIRQIQSTNNLEHIVDLFKLGPWLEIQKRYVLVLANIGLSGEDAIKKCRNFFQGEKFKQYVPADTWDKDISEIINAIIVANNFFSDKLKKTDGDERMNALVTASDLNKFHGMLVRHKQILENKGGHKYYMLELRKIYESIKAGDYKGHPLFKFLGERIDNFLTNYTKFGWLTNDATIINFRHDLQSL